MSKDVLDKLDALLNKHKEPETEASTTVWMPVLTEVVKRGSLPREPAAAAPVPPAAASPQPETPQEATAPTVVEIPEFPVVQPFPDPGEVAEQILSLLEPRLNQLLTREISATVRKSLDQTVSELLAQLDAHVRNAVQESVRERIAEVPLHREA